MDDVWTLEEIQARFASEWVLVADPELTETLAVVRGRVLWHSRDRDEVYRKARELRPQHSAILYTGTLPDEAAVVLWAFRSIFTPGSFRWSSQTSPRISAAVSACEP